MNDQTKTDFGVIIVGDEILSAKRQDKHLSKVIELLAARGLPLACAEYVGDDPARITAALARAFASGDVVFYGRYRRDAGRSHTAMRGCGSGGTAGAAPGGGRVHS